MTRHSLILGAISAGAVAAIAGCGGASGATPTPTASSGGFTIPSIPGLGGGTSGNASASTLINVTAVQTISGDPNVAAVSGGCSATICAFADTTGSGGGGGLVFVQPFPGGLGQAALQAALTAALASGGSTSSGTSVTAVSGLGSAAIKSIDANSATYAFSKDNYFVVISVSSTTNSGAAMDSQVAAAAQTAAGKV
jgi:hypothetical protein